jgi:hypothetical protein
VVEDLAKFFADIIEFIVGGVLFLASLLERRFTRYIKTIQASFRALPPQSAPQATT